jgi:hypothetical protein
MTPNRLTLIFSLSLMLSLGGCVDLAEETVELNLGSVSFGNQILDLKTAFDAGALSKVEYLQAKSQVLSILDTADALAAAVDADDDSDGKAENGTEMRVAIEFDTRDNEAETPSHDDGDNDDDDGWIF